MCADKRDKKARGIQKCDVTIAVQKAKRLCARLPVLVVFCRHCMQRGLPIAASLKEGFRLKREQKQGLLFVVNTDWVLNERKDTFLCNEDYYTLSLALYDLNDREIFCNKFHMLDRCPDLIGRDYINAETASEEELLSFIARNEMFVAKKNYGAGGEGVQIYNANEAPALEVLKQIRKNGQVLLEGYIRQHPLLNEIHPNAVNTLRIHTVNNGDEVRSYIAPKLRIGCGASHLDVSGPEGTYRLVLREDGTVNMVAYGDRFGFWYKAQRYQNSGIDLWSLTIPFVKESVDLCIEAAKRFPEGPFIGWDVAITPDGPVLVEANDISGAFSTYQTINYLYHGVGMRAEIEEMLAFAKPKRKNEELNI